MDAEETPLPGMEEMEASAHALDTQLTALGLDRET